MRTAATGRADASTDVHFQRGLLAHAEMLRDYVAARIPTRFQAVISPEDVLQDVWISAFAHYASFNATKPDALDRWLMSITNHKLIDALKSAGRLKRGGGVQHTPPAGDRRTSLCDLFARVASRRRTPSRDVGAAEAAHTLQIALSRLSDDRRTAIQLRYLEGQSRSEIARQMQKSEAAVNSLLFHGLRELRRWMGDIARFFSDVRSSDDAAL